MNTNTKFLDPQQVLFQAGIARGSTVVDLGAGSGYFAIPAAKMAGASGKIFVVDVQEEALEHISSSARLNKLNNIQTIRKNLEKDAVEKVVAGTVDMVIISNVLHQLKNSSNVMAESYRMLKSGGKLLIIEWNETASTIGPKASERISSEQIKSLAEKSNFKLNTIVNTDQYHFGLIFSK